MEFGQEYKCLKRLNIYGNKIKRLKIDDSICLESLIVYDNPLEEIEINTKKIYHLDISDTKLKEIPNFERNQKIKYLNIASSEIKCINGGKYEEIDCTNSKIENLNIENVQTLILVNTPIKNIKYWTELMILKYHEIQKLMIPELYTERIMGYFKNKDNVIEVASVSYTHLRAHET